MTRQKKWDNANHKQRQMTIHGDSHFLKATVLEKSSLKEKVRGTSVWQKNLPSPGVWHKKSHKSRKWYPPGKKKSVVWFFPHLKIMKCGTIKVKVPGCDILPIFPTLNKRWKRGEPKISQRRRMRISMRHVRTLRHVPVPTWRGCNLWIKRG
jgi:hypothetical protein